MLQLKFVLKRKPKKKYLVHYSSKQPCNPELCTVQYFLYKIYLLESENYKTMRSWYSVRKYRIRATIIFF